MTREEMLIAYVDDELAPAERASFEAQLNADPALAAEAARHRRLATRVGTAFSGVLDEPVPPALVAVASAANDRGRANALMRLGRWSAMAACLVVGVLAGHNVWPHAGPFDVKGGVLTARGGLADALDRGLSADQGLVRVGLTLRTGDGQYCRAFRSFEDGIAGVACREDRRWVARTVTAWRPAGAPAYRTAASGVPPEILAAVDQLGGQTLDATAERAARDAGWR